jgi:hypothetical protein
MIIIIIDNNNNNINDNNINNNNNNNNIINDSVKLINFFLNHEFFFGNIFKKNKKITSCFQVIQ